MKIYVVTHSTRALPKMEHDMPRSAFTTKEAAEAFIRQEKALYSARRRNDLYISEIDLDPEY